ncbi:MAG: hypothetical protein E7222_10410 [Clostridiales bacterium]|nr:hypothetical protein [Clostridiales bacterium]
MVEVVFDILYEVYLINVVSGLVYFLHATFSEEEQLRKAIQMFNPDADADNAVEQINEKKEYYAGNIDITRTMNKEEIASTMRFWGLNDAEVLMQKGIEKQEDHLDECTAEAYCLTEDALRDVLYEMGYKQGRINKEISQTKVKVSLEESMDETFAKAFSYLIPYDELLKKIKTAKAERIERIRIRTEESWRFY